MRKTAIWFLIVCGLIAAIVVVGSIVESADDQVLPHNEYYEKNPNASDPSDQGYQEDTVSVEDVGPVWDDPEDGRRLDTL